MKSAWRCLASIKLTNSIANLMVLLTSSRTADPAAMTAFYGWQRGCCPSVGNSISALRRSLAFVSRSDRTCSFRPPLVANSRLSMLNVSAFGRFARCARLSRSGENEEIYRKTCCKDQWGGGIGSAISPPAGLRRRAGGRHRCQCCHCSGSRGNCRGRRLRLLPA